MSAQTSDVPGQQLDPAMPREVVRRATQLCHRAEPHTDQVPCTSHLSEANRQLMGLVA